MSRVLGGRYALQEVLGEGGFAVVSRAVDRKLGRSVAVKSLRAGTSVPDSALSRFLQEAMVMGGLSHPHVVTVLDLVEEPDSVHLVLEYMEGGSLANRISRRGPLPPRDVAALAAALLEALETAHSRGIVHRDLKPGNLLFTAEGQVKLGDFGIAHVPLSQGGLGLTGPGAVLGTATYLAPEAFGGRYSAASDLYSLGLTLFEALRGRLPWDFSGCRGLEDVARLVRTVPPVRLGPGHPGGLVRAIEAALEPDPRDRPASAAAMARLLSQEPTPAPPPRAEALPDVTALLEAPGHVRVVDAPHLLLWPGPAQLKEDGIQAAPGAVGLAAFEIPSIPDFASSRFPGDPARELDRLVAALHGLAPHLPDRAWFTLRFRKEERRLRLYLLAGTAAPSPGSARRHACEIGERLLAVFPRDLYTLEPVTDSLAWERLLDVEGVGVVEEVAAAEDVLPRAEGAPYYVPRPLVEGAGRPENDMLGVCAALLETPGPALLDLCLVPTVLAEAERVGLTSMLGLLEKAAQERTTSTTFGGGYQRTWREEGDPRAAEALTVYRRRQEVLSREPLFAFSFRTASAAGAASVTRRLVGVLPAPPGDLPVVSRGEPGFPEALDALRVAGLGAAACRTRLWGSLPLPRTFRRLPRLCTLDEARALFRLPLPKGRPCPGLPADTGLGQAPSVGRGGVALDLGERIAYGRSTGEALTLPLERLVRHALVLGQPGKGKTTFLFRLLHELWERHGIPFLVLELGKTEYRGLAGVRPFQDPDRGLWVFTPGRADLSPFAFNPFRVPPGVPVATHVGHLKACFTGAFAMPPPGPTVMQRALERAYARKGWSFRTGRGGAGAPPSPTLADLLSAVHEIVDESSYAGELRSNVEAVVLTRLAALESGPRGDVFNVHEGVPLEELLQRPVLLELGHLPAEEKALLALFLLTALDEHRKAHPPAEPGLQHLTLVEEAHNLLGGGREEGDPRAEVVRHLAGMLAELRALGEGLVLCNQLPSMLHPDVVKLPGVRVLFGIDFLEDRKLMEGTMSFSRNQGHLDLAGRLPTGQALVFFEGLDEAAQVRTADFKSEHGLSGHAGEAEVARRMEPFARQRPQAFMPFPECPQGCAACNPRWREDSEEMVLNRRAELAAWEDGLRSAPEFQDLLAAGATPCELLVKDWVRRHPEWEEDQPFCAFVHYLHRVRRGRPPCSPECLCTGRDLPQKVFAETATPLLQRLHEPGR